jgi:5-methylcytosine-specific restriction endonuclease McrA
LQEAGINITDTSEPIVKKERKPRKKTIPPSLKLKVWNKYVGEEIGKTKCLCCKLQDIYQASFSCGHIISENNGGLLNVDNLKPICASCNSSMGTKNMNDYIKEYGF